MHGKTDANRYLYAPYLNICRKAKSISMYYSSIPSKILLFKLGMKPCMQL